MSDAHQNSNPVDLTNPLWGVGYGSRRHLVDVTTLGKVLTARAFARCGSAGPRFIALDYIAGTPGPVTVSSYPPCARCQKLADKEHADA